MKLKVSREILPNLRRMAFTNVGLFSVVLACWVLFGNSRAFAAFEDHWPVAATMTLGSLVGGGTSEGGGAVAFPVMTKVLSVPPEQARLFSFAIQSVGMGAATISILINRVPIERFALRWGGLPAMVTAILSVVWIAPGMHGPTVRVVFTAALTGLMIALIFNYARRPARRQRVPMRGRRESCMLAVAGSFGGIVSGVAAVGENTIMFVLLVLGFRVCERVVTPTTVVLMTLVTWASFAAHLMLLRDFTGEVVDMWLAAVPVVALGAPLGALICTRLSRQTIATILCVLITGELISTLLLVPMTLPMRIGFALGLAIFTSVCIALTLQRRYDLPADEADPLSMSSQPSHEEKTGTARLSVVRG